MPDPDRSIYIYFIPLAALVLLNAFFALSETAVITMNDAKLRKMSTSGDRRAKTLEKMLDTPSEFLSAVQAGVTLSGFLAAVIAADAFTSPVTALLTGLGLPVSSGVLRTVSLVLITALLSFFILAIGELVPKRVAVKYCDAIALASAAPLRCVYFLTKPFVFLISAAANGVLRLFGISPGHQAEEVTEEEIRMMLDVGEESGNIEQSEKDMIHNIFDFGDRTAEEMMTHRTEITAIELGTPLREIIDLTIESGYSRIPVYEDDLDSIAGILYVKDLLKYVTESPGATRFDAALHMRPALFVPESTIGSELLREFREKKLQMAIVVDEYGGTSGLVTMEDLIESIVGSIQDEYDDEEEEIVLLDDGRCIVDGLAPLEEVARFFGIEIPDEDNFDTIGGYVVHQLGYIPEEDEFPVVSAGGVMFTVRGMEDRRILKLEASRIKEIPS